MLGLPNLFVDTGNQTRMIDTMTDRKFYKTIVQVEILSQEPIEITDLDTIHYNITEGDWSLNVVSSKELNGKEAAGALLNQASDPSFFQLTKNGEDTE